MSYGQERPSNTKKKLSIINMLLFDQIEQTEFVESRKQSRFRQFCPQLYMIQNFKIKKISYQIVDYSKLLYILQHRKMQKLYKVALQRILTKIGANQLNSLTVSNLRPLLEQKNISFSQIDQNIFHKLPRQQLKNLIRNPCPISKGEQTLTDKVQNAKAMRAALNIVEKKICFRCPFVDKCDKAFIQPTSDYKIDNPLENLLISMKNIADVEQNNGQIKNRSWFSGVRICDSLNTVIDDLLQGGEQFKTFKIQRTSLKNQVQQKQKLQEQPQKRILKGAKKNKIPLRNISPQIITSQISQIPTPNQQEQKLQQPKKEPTKEPRNVFKQKKGEQFIKIAQKYLNDQTIEKSDKKSTIRQQNLKKDRQKTKIDIDPQERTEKRQFKKQNQRPTFNKGIRNYQQKSERKLNRKQENINQEEIGQDRKWKQYQNTRSFRKDEFDQRNYNKKSQPQVRQYKNRQRANDFGNQQTKVSRSDEQFQNPKIRRLSKDRPKQYQNQGKNTLNEKKSYKPNEKLDKFYSEMIEEKSDQEQILSQLNKRSYSVKESRLPRDAKLTNNENYKRERKDNIFSNQEKEKFNKLQKIPKILNSQIASKQDLQERIQQQQESLGQTAEKKGRKVKRL